MSSGDVLRARPETSALALAALKNDALWPDLLPKTGRGKPVPIEVQDDLRAAQSARIDAVKRSMKLAQFAEVSA
ncbi:hypothetical protein [uncultured Zhongshania sp.]|uniref:hypothetical protein n=1 Tax=uncultured Zhongshania sp. TaxID=1642288 RepID=UPI0030DA9721